MSRSVNDFVTQIQPIIKDRTDGTVEVADIRNSLNRSVTSLQSKHGIQTLRNRTTLNVFPDVFEYAVPTDMGYPIKWHVRGEPKETQRLSPAEFWLRINQQNNIFAIDNVLNSNFLLLKSSQSGKSTRLHDMDSLTSNGTWSGSADATNLTLDTVNKKQGGGCINFDIDVSASVNNYAGITNSDMQAVDLSEFENNGFLFLWVFIPDVTNVTSILGRWGSSSSNYWEASDTTQHSGRALSNGWNRIGLDWAGATETGTGDSSAINYALLRVVYGAGQGDDTDYRFDDIRMESFEINDVDYYTSYGWLGSDGTTYKNRATADDDSTIFSDAVDDYLMFKATADAFWILERMDEAQKAEDRATVLLTEILANQMSDRKRPTARWY